YRKGFGKVRWLYTDIQTPECDGRTNAIPARVGLCTLLRQAFVARELLRTPAVRLDRTRGRVCPKAADGDRTRIPGFRQSEDAVSYAIPRYGARHIPGSTQAAFGAIRRGCGVQGPEIAEFEQKFAKYCGARHAVTTSYGRMAFY